MGSCLKKENYKMLKIFGMALAASALAGRIDPSMSNEMQGLNLTATVRADFKAKAWYNGYYYTSDSNNDFGEACARDIYSHECCTEDIYVAMNWASTMSWSTQQSWAENDYDACWWNHDYHYEECAQGTFTCPDALGRVIGGIITAIIVVLVILIVIIVVICKCCCAAAKAATGGDQNIVINNNAQGKYPTQQKVQMQQPQMQQPQMQQQQGMMMQQQPMQQQPVQQPMQQQWQQPMANQQQMYPKQF